MDVDARNFFRVGDIVTGQLQSQMCLVVHVDEGSVTIWRDGSDGFTEFKSVEWGHFFKDWVVV